jgi:hypothetical protein
MGSDRGMASVVKETAQEEMREASEATGEEELGSASLFSSNDPRFFERLFVRG